MPITKAVVAPHDLSDIYFDKGENTSLEIEYKFQYSISKLRTANNIPNIVFVTDAGKQGLFQYDSSDTSSIDNGTSIIVNNGKIFKKVSSADTYLLARANHTGTQTISTISSLQSVLDTKLNFIVSSTFATIPVQTTGTYKLILVLVDETNGSSPTLYFYDGTGLQWIPTSKLY